MNYSTAEAQQIGQLMSQYHLELDALLKTVRAIEKAGFSAPWVDIASSRERMRLEVRPRSGAQ